LLSTVGYAETFDSAHRRTLAWFANQDGTADLRALARTVTSEIAREWFGLPDFADLMNDDADPGPPIPATAPPPMRETRPARCPVDFLHSSQYIFRPNPTTALETVARRRGRVIFDAAQAFVSGHVSAKCGSRPTLLEALRGDSRYRGNYNAAVVGAINGFAVPTSSSLLSILDTWIETLEIGRLRQWYASLPLEQVGELQKVFSLTDFRKPLADALLRAFVERPVPDLLHRTAVGHGQLGDVPVKPGDRVVISLASAALAAQEQGQADFWTILFGGDRSPEAGTGPLHACPGQSMAFGTLFGIITALLSQETLRRKGKLTLTYDAKHASALAAAAPIAKQQSY
jgi:hypothetical protein